MSGISNEDINAVGIFFLQLWFLIPLGFWAGAVGIVALLADPIPWPLGVVSLSVSGISLKLLYEIVRSDE